MRYYLIAGALLLALAVAAGWYFTSSKPERAAPLPTPPAPAERPPEMPGRGDLNPQRPSVPDIQPNRQR
ncbi:MAG: hypothetical protein IT538_07450 [Variibacter sp.]|nr:hypothetical protein [Variibacter sp.]